MTNPRTCTPIMDVMQLTGQRHLSLHPIVYRGPVAYACVPACLDGVGLKQQLRMLTDAEFYMAARRSPYLLLPGISMGRIFPDYLHIVDLALAPEAAASDSLLQQVNMEDLHGM